MNEIIGGAWYFLLILGAFSAHWFALRAAKAALLPDQKQYDKVWAEVQEQGKDDVEVLRQAVRLCGDAPPPLDHVRQPVNDLQVLLNYAESVNDRYQELVAEWAGSLQVHHKRAPLKHIWRILEKIDRSYGGDPTRVLDFVRSSLVVEDMGEVIACLKFVSEYTRVLKVKNRYDPAYDGDDTAGYRDLNLQLNLRESDAFPPLPAFVFELQIILHRFEELKSEGGHARYITCRNLRGD